ncbi:hypothetical protein B0H13DRAFT_1911789 [Mycena leptocephala]|nr:hypothetical protein B0H13DRAFT_1911789 [Mycena leptocephala]
MRKALRAERNRIAAQKSRDRRNTEFSSLGRRVRELEEENRRLRAAVLVALAQLDPTKAQEAATGENEQLRKRFKTLEKGWNLVVKALVAPPTSFRAMMAQPHTVFKLP